MQEPNTNLVIAFPKTSVREPADPGEKSAVHIDPNVPAPIDLTVVALGDQRAQIRLPLENLDQAEAAIMMIRDALDKSMTQIRSARRRNDLTALVAVRQLIATANRHVNAYRKGR